MSLDVEMIGGPLHRRTEHLERWQCWPGFRLTREIGSKIHTYEVLDYSPLGFRFAMWRNVKERSTA